MISADSRYADSRLVSITDQSSKAQIIIVPSSAGSFTFSYIYYQVKILDRVDSIAQAFYGDSLQWWNIADANPEIMDWMNLKVGTLLRIPNL